MGGAALCRAALCGSAWLGSWGRWRRGGACHRADYPRGDLACRRVVRGRPQRGGSIGVDLLDVDALGSTRGSIAGGGSRCGHARLEGEELRAVIVGLRGADLWAAPVQHLV